MNQLLIIGGGLAGAVLALESKKRGLSFRWYLGNSHPVASRAAYGMCNPVHFRNRVEVWKAEQLLSTSRKFFFDAQQLLGGAFTSDMPIHHLVADQQDEILWRQNYETTEIWKYTDANLRMELKDLIDPHFLGCISIHQSFVVDVPGFLDAVIQYLSGICVKEDLLIEGLVYKSDHWIYDGVDYQSVVFCEGVRGLESPFGWVPFNPCKGEVIRLSIADYHLNTAIHKKVMLVPLGDSEFFCGSTYEWKDLSSSPTEKGRAELENHLKEILGNHRSYQVIDQLAGVRPAVSDRRPVVGWHPQYDRMGILNGFGSRGLLVAPSAAGNLLDNFQKDEPIWKEWDVQRFKKRIKQG